MSRRGLVILTVAALAAVTGQVVVSYVPGPPPLIWELTHCLVGLSFLAAGLAAWLRWPASWLGLLFTIAGYLWLLPNLGRLPYALPFTAGNLAASLYGAALAHLALAWPTAGCAPGSRWAWWSRSTPGPSARASSRCSSGIRGPTAVPAARPTC